jgi:hypothetical protein
MSQNFLKKTRVYLIGHMEYTDGRGWRNDVKDELTPRGITVFDPYEKPFLNEIKEDEDARNDLKSWMRFGEYDKVTERMHEVRSDDLRLCDISDFFIAKIQPSIASWGSAEELTTANRMKKPIFLVVEGGKEKCPLWLMGMLKHKYIYNSVEEALDIIKKIDDGIIVPDSTRWRLLKPSFR